MGTRTANEIQLCPRCKGVLSDNECIAERCYCCNQDLTVFSKEELEAHFGPNVKGMYSFCESVYATGHGNWHLRVLTEAGKKLGGGIDSPGLCGHPKVTYGWDLEVGLTEHHLEKNTCKRCLAIYQEAMS